jgi:hypothetical protein
VDGGIVTTVLSWRPDAIGSDDLIAGLKVARALQKSSVPPWLSKQLANYTLRAATALAERGVTVPDK